jgi:hypothetical protein
MQNEGGQNMATLMYTMFDGLVLANLFMALVSVALFGLIFHKAGYSWALGLLMLVPLVNIVMFVLLALGRWPIEDHLDKARGTLIALGHPLEESPPVGQAERNPTPPGKVPLRERIRSAFRRAQTRRKDI